MKEVLSKTGGRTGKMPNRVAAVEHRPDVLKTFLPLYEPIINQGAAVAKYKEPA
jgi:hypothetical protein